MRFFIATLFLSCSLVSCKRDLEQDQYCFYSCQQALSSQSFGGLSSDDSACSNTLLIQSTYFCLLAYCTTEEIEAGIKYGQQSCRGDGSLPASIAAANVSSSELPNLPLLTYADYNDPPEETNNTVLVSSDLYNAAIQTVTIYYTGETHNESYAQATYIFWAVVCGLGTMWNLLSLVLSATSSTKTRSKSASTKMWARIYSVILLPAPSRIRNVGMVPGRLEALIIGLYILINVILMGVNYTYLDENIWWETKSLQMSRYFADRCGYLTIANTAITWAFAIRNNILISLTGWEFPTFNRFHRWVARVAVLQAVCHALSYSANSDYYGGFSYYASNYADQYWWCGVIALFCFGLLMPFSIMYLRVRFYDVFLVTHIVFAVGALVGIWYHVIIFHGKYDGYVWACVGFWTFDRAFRLLRVLYSWARSKSWKSVVTYNADTDLIRVDATDVFASRKTASGTHFFIYSPLSFLPWQSHPFTVVKYLKADETSTPQSIQGATRGASEKEKEIKITTRQDSETSNIMRAKPCYSFLIRPSHRGFTSRLRKACSAQPQHMAMWFEGPYGKAPRLKQFKNILIFVGGSGISVGINQVYAALEGPEDTKITLVWSSRGESGIAMMNDICERELKVAMQQINVVVERYATVAKIADDDERQIGLREQKEIGRAHQEMVSFGRPDIQERVLSAARNTQSPLAVVVCGPAGMIKDAQMGVHEAIRQGHSNVELMVEAFDW